MSLDRVDQALTEWKSIVDDTAQKLVEVHNLPSYEFLVGPPGSPKPKLSGVTESRVTPALAAVERVMHGFGTLSDTVQRANGARQQISRFPGRGSDEKIREIHHLLTQPCVPTPNGQITLRQLAARIDEDFRAAQAALTEIDKTWKQLDAKLASAASFVNDHPAERAVDPLRAQLETLRKRVIQDPIGADRDFDRQINPVLQQVRTAMEALVQQRVHIHENLARGRDLLRRLVELRHEAEESFTECKEKITAHTPPTPPLPPDRIAALYEWLTRLESKLGEGYVDPVCLGLENWMGHVNELITVEERACAENRMPLELRRELRGRLLALRAKAKSRGFGDDARLAQIAERADRLLHARPTPMKEVTGLVTLYESKLNGVR